MANNKMVQHMDIITQNMELIKEMADKGKSKREIAIQLKIAPTSFYRIVNNNTELQEIFETADYEITQRVKQALASLCEKRMVKKTKVLPSGEIIQYEEEVEPDLRAVFYWLNNKSGGEFANRQEVQVTKRSYEIIIVDDDGNDVTPPVKHPVIESVDYKVSEDSGGVDSE